MIHLTVMMTNNETIDRNETFDSDNDKHLNVIAIIFKINIKQWRIQEFFMGGNF